MIELDARALLSIRNGYRSFVDEHSVHRMVHMKIEMVNVVCEETAQSTASCSVD